MRLSTVLPMAGAFGAAALAAYFAAGVSVRALEGASARGVGLELNLEGHDWASVQADGLQVVISGEAPTEAARFQAMSVAAGVVDAARVIDNMSVSDREILAPPDFKVEILRNEAGISLFGLIPAATDRTALLRQLGRAVGESPITDLLETADHAAPEGWNAALRYAAEALGDLPRSKISVTAGRVDITAAAESAQARNRLEAALSRAAPDGVRTALRITAPRPVITPFALRFVVGEEGAEFDSCSADTEAARDAILAAAVSAGFEGKSECRIGLGAPTPRWSDAAVASVNAIGALGSGAVTLADTSVSLVATLGTDQALFDRVAAELDAALPDVFSLTAVLPEPEVTTEDGPARFTATRSPEGQVQMRGHIGDALAETAVHAYAKSRFGAEQTYLAAEDHSALPQGWSLRALAGLAALAEVEFGAVEVSTDTLSVRGETGNQDGRTRVTQILSDALGEGQAFSIAVRYNEALDPLANIPTPEECLEQIVGITTAKKLTFEPGSADLDADSLETLGAVADVLKGCPEFEMVVEGHTDSQGREVMNLALSQERAEAVVAALRARRLAWPGIVPQGFGEAQPIADNGTEEGREANRRIAFRILRPEEELPEETTPDQDEEESPDE